MIRIRSRKMIVPREERMIGVVSDHNSETRTFAIDRFQPNGIDMSALTFGLDMEYEDSTHKNATYLEREYDEETIYLTWTIIENDVSAGGTMFVQISAHDYEGTVKWASMREAFYIEPVIGTAGDYKGDLSALERLETLFESRTEQIIEGEAGRVAAEAARVEAETSRSLVETERAEAEAARKATEQEREAAEQKREAKETARVSAETERDTAESERVSAETSRTEAETERSLSESVRTSAEDGRKAEEQSREEAEAGRKTAENERIQAEAARTNAFTDWMVAEESGVVAEGERKTAESARLSAETVRQDTEELRISAEAARGTAEEARETAESARKIAEESRMLAETERVAAEQGRNTAEESRTAAEGLRISEEMARSVAEGIRTESFATAISKSELATNAANQAAKDVQEILTDGGFVSSSERENWNNAYEQMHSHVNQVVLENVTMERVIAWDEKAEKTEASLKTAGLMSPADKEKLDGIEAGAEANQEAVGSIKAGNTVVQAGGTSAQVELTAGTNISITGDNATKKVTISGPSSLPNPQPLAIQINGTTAASYNGSAAHTVNITAAGIGAASSEDIVTLTAALKGFEAKTTVFNPDGSITETGDTGTKVTVFNPDDSITESFTNLEGLTISKKTVFNGNVSVAEEVI